MTLFSPRNTAAPADTVSWMTGMFPGRTWLLAPSRRGHQLRPRTATRAHPLGLTRREQEVLDQIVEGLTNGEIAGKLFISAKTVDHHVSAVLAKLGAPTRGVAASEAFRLGVARPTKASRFSAE